MLQRKKLNELQRKKLNEPPKNYNALLRKQPNSEQLKKHSNALPKRPLAAPAAQACISCRRECTAALGVICDASVWLRPRFFKYSM